MFPHPRLVNILQNDKGFFFKYVSTLLISFFFPVWVQKHPGSLLEGFTKTQVSTLAVKDKFLVAGGFQGELICKVRSRVLRIMDFTQQFHAI